MPKIVQETIEQIGWDDMHARRSHYAPKPVHARTPGLHLSGILRFIAINHKLLKGIDPVTGKWVGDEDADLLEEDMPLRMALGMALEEWIAPLYPDMIWQPGELYKDGITGSPDGLSLLGNNDLAAKLAKRLLGECESIPVIEEFKCTWKSSRHGILEPKTQIWLWQGAGYAHMYGNGCRHVRFNILWVNGDYGKGGIGGPEYRRYLVEYTQQELDNIWSMILKNKDQPGVRIEQ